ncbi:MAG: hypothetical protein K2G27_04100, partial [Duncaniella sp.]|nr:hypothetical protein [Duncaniella sp.]
RLRRARKAPVRQEQEHPEHERQEASDGQEEPTVAETQNSPESADGPRAAEKSLATEGHPARVMPTIGVVDADLIPES